MRNPGDDFHQHHVHRVARSRLELYNARSDSSTIVFAIPSGVSIRTQMDTIAYSNCYAADNCAPCMPCRRIVCRKMRACLAHGHAPMACRARPVSILITRPLLAHQIAWEENRSRALGAPLSDRWRSPAGDGPRQSARACRRDGCVGLRAIARSGPKQRTKTEKERAERSLSSFSIIVFV